ncbi:electron transfer flavoprotein subunit beta/FixA family protein [Arthrobacter sp. ISL-5]|uniref:electron transfer flavoprotein subunit beta/FixA family protein n=1 Tax=Arthrobacter sp. ISL-5 TaxID=2819111 RepID=UPI001BE6B309|nr:electron transfer flavoprotein subunit beta/FixA family protein [Arthrobacter sp. ISL-5]MBT2554160.1 electron transfer flavoprotein subunit beta/FixA family protein [Arthrobacter sp. ISL-5]
MKILVLSKEVPDTGTERVLDPVTGILDRSASDPVADEINERTLEHALRYRDAGGTAEIVILTVGPETAAPSVRKFLAMGADSAVIVSDPEIAGADAARTAQIIAAAVQKVGPDLVLAGNESTDGWSGLVPSMVAEFLGWPVLPALFEIEIATDKVSGSTVVEAETLGLSASLPAVAAVTERSADARFPNFKGLMQAKKKPLEVWNLADIGATEARAATSVMVSATRRPARAAGVKISDDGTAANQLVDFLASNRLI